MAGVEMALKETMARLLAQAQAADGSPRRVHLWRGLRIDVRVMDGKVYLQLSRGHVAPSEQELKTVLKHWPVGAPDEAWLNREPLQHEGRWFLVTSWRATDGEADSGG